MAANNNIVVLDESTLSFLSAENGGKPLGGRGSVANPALGAHVQRSQTPYLVGRSLLPRTSARSRPSASIFGPSILIAPVNSVKSWAIH